MNLLLSHFIPKAQAAEAKLSSIDFVTTDIRHIVSVVINVLLSFAGTTAIIYIIYSGILYMTAAGNPDAVKKGQTGLIYGAIGIAVVVLGRYIVTTVASLAQI